MHPFQTSKVAIFDLDGTLYQEYSFLERYITYLLKDKLSEREVHQTVNEAYQILAGEHPIQLGHFLDREKKIVFLYKEERIAKAFSWEGVEQTVTSDLVNLESEQLAYLGDPWCVANFYIEKHQIAQEKCVAAFNQVRKEMLQSPFSIERCEPLFTAIEKLEVERKVFMTNTPSPSGEEFVNYLNIGGLFDEYMYDAKKPLGMSAYVKHLLEEGYKPEHILSIGDNPWNDLYPVKAVGGKTCLITRYTHHGLLMEPDVTVKTVDQLAEVLTARTIQITG
ncbi:HAD family hydrolase [Alkalihalobacillus oceani]|uniref:HAD family hydrolase n=1 Tax=Halalkalibacter oceani TaxID=1653776 RepID=A0A9X2DRQ3_9BACI|nr:HAD family hydrolase [Halalkalibacter oceani]MCM3715824.1 HAD family hydrolase [Halalkalibacter oceani]